MIRKTTILISFAIASIASVYLTIHSFCNTWWANSNYSTLNASDSSTTIEPRKTSKSIDFKQFLPFNKFTIVVIFQDHNRILWVGTQKNGLWKKNYTMPTIVQVNEFKHTYITTIFQDNSQMIWIGTKNNGLWKKPSSDDKWKHCYEVKASWITTIVQDNENHLLVGTRWYGLLEQNKTDMFVKNSEIFTSGTRFISAIFQDRESNIWVGTRNKNLWKKTKGSHEYQKIPIPTSWGGDIHIFFEDKNKNLWIGTNYNGLWEVKGGKGKIVRDSFLNGNFFVNNIVGDSEGNIWIATEDVGLYEKLLNSNSHIVFPGTEYLDIKTILCDSNNNLWFGTLSQGLFEIKGSNQSSTPIRVAQNVFASSQINVVFIDYDKNLWVCQTRQAVWEDNRDCGIFIKPSPNSPYYMGNQNYDGIFKDPFFITVAESNVASILINGVAVSPNDINKSRILIHITMANTLIRFIVNYRIKTQVGQTNLAFFHQTYLIKSNYLDNGHDEQNKLDDAIFCAGGRKLMNYQVMYINRDPTHTRYHLFTNLYSRSPRAKKPSLIIDRSKLNFLTDYTHSTFSEIKIVNGAILKQSSFNLANRPSIVLDGTPTCKLYEVSLVDFLGNKNSFLIQEGGLVLNTNFLKHSSPTNKKLTWYYVGITIGIVAFALIAWAIARRIYNSQHSSMFTTPSLIFRKQLPRISNKRNKTPPNTMR